MSELRKDPVSKRWVIFSPNRANRPDDYCDDSKETIENNKNCPFCEGNELESGEEILAYDKTSIRKPNTKGWWVRVLNNKFPVLNPRSNLVKRAEGIYDKMNDLGIHEIIVETPNHETRFEQLTQEEIEKVLSAYKERYFSIKENKDIEYILIFKNFGKDAGATLAHAHSQIIATPVIPNRVMVEVENSNEYYKFRDRCVFCDILTQELSSGKRVIEENEYYVSFFFYAGRFPYETWILPKRHIAQFEETTIDEIKSLASILKNTLQKLSQITNNGAYNYVIHTLPTKINDMTYYHWHIEIMPKTTKIAGFEWGSGFYINPILPENAAKSITEKVGK